MNRSLWLENPALPAAEPPLPQRVDVLIVGASLAGLHMAEALARSGAKVLVLEARSRLAEADIGRGVGLGQVGTEEPPHQLLAALGLERCREYVAFSRRSAALLRAFGVPLQQGALRICASEAEASALDADLAACASLDLPAARWSAEQVASHTGTTGLGPARFCPEDLLYDPVATAELLAQRARAAGAILRLNSPVLAVEGEEPVAVLEQGRVSTELLVYCCGWQAMSLESGLAALLTPVRVQHLRLPWSGPTGAACAQRGYLFWSAWQGQLSLGGARWATPHMETWETDDSQIVEAIDQKLLAMLRRCFPGADAPTARWSAILTHTCDNLPLLGPLPGQPRRLACLGFREHGATLGLEAGRCVAEGILEGQSAALPEGLRISRMLG